ncbi:MAG: M48 family metallopeptidase [Gluconacetobacter diazotrophicus]|nr:M48 family metallopeptidase [Gluconacetobacter diazotrophicus]
MAGAHTAVAPAGGGAGGAAHGGAAHGAGARTEDGGGADYAVIQPRRRPEALEVPVSAAPDSTVEELPVRWRRSPRARRVSLRIDPREGTVVVTLPSRASRRTGLALLRDHADWVARRLAALPPTVALADGAAVMLHGRPHPIRHVPDGRRGVWVEADEIRVSGEPAFLPRRTADFLRAEARKRLSALVKEVAGGRDGDTALVPRRLSIRDTATRWGSCSADRTVMFSWRLVMAPPEVQHYVVAHELAHLRHMDHGNRFWALVERLTPHRAEAETWLRLNAATLLRTG